MTLFEGHVCAVRVLMPCKMRCTFVTDHKCNLSSAIESRSRRWLIRRSRHVQVSIAGLKRRPIGAPLILVANRYETWPGEDLIFEQLRFRQASSFMAPEPSDQPSQPVRRSDVYSVHIRLDFALPQLQ